MKRACCKTRRLLKKNPTARSFGCRVRMPAFWGLFRGLGMGGVRGVLNVFSAGHRPAAHPPRRSCSSRGMGHVDCASSSTIVALVVSLGQGSSSEHLFFAWAALTVGPSASLVPPDAAGPMPAGGSEPAP